MTTKSTDKPIIGSNTLITVGGIANVPAKIDTGADSSAIWASDLTIADDVLYFKLFAPGSPYYTGETLAHSDYTAAAVRSSNGQSEVRYRTQLPVIINGRRIKVNFTLADRHRNHFPVLIGRRTLRGKFLVDVAQRTLARPKSSVTLSLNRELRADPQAFHHKHIKGARS